MIEICATIVSFHLCFHFSVDSCVFVCIIINWRRLCSWCIGVCGVRIFGCIRYLCQFQMKRKTKYEWISPFHIPVLLCSWQMECKPVRVHVYVCICETSSIFLFSKLGFGEAYNTQYLEKSIAHIWCVKNRFSKCCWISNTIIFPV